MVDPLIGKSGKLGNPVADVIAVGVEFFALRNGVENSEKRGGSGPATGDPLPVKTIIGKIGIDECVPEPARALLPREHEVLGEKRTGDHAYPVVHPADVPELPHSGIHDGITGLPLRPGGKSCRVCLPGHAVKLGF